MYLYKKAFGQRVIYFISPCVCNTVGRVSKWVLIWDVLEPRTTTNDGKCDWKLYCGGNLLDTPGLALWAGAGIEESDVASKLELLVTTGCTLDGVMNRFSNEIKTV